jgi:hypothetical protein
VEAHREALPDVLALLALPQADARALLGPRAGGVPGLLRLQEEGRVSEPQSFGHGRPVDWPVESMLAELESIADRLRHGIPDPAKPSRRWSLTAFSLFAAARVRSRDKLPAPERGRGSAGGHGDPTYSETSARVADNDADLKAWHEWRTDVQLMLNYGRHAVELLDKATPAQQRPDRPETGRCRVCGEGPIYRGRPEDVSERCRWCYDRWIEFGQDMPQRIVKWHKQGKRVTSTMIRAELAEEMVG